MKSSTTAKDRLAEDKIFNYLENQRLVPEAHNFRSGPGNGTCIFINIRSPNKSSILDAAETISSRKRIKII